MKELQPEQVIDLRYRLIRVMSEGTFGTVWLAEHLALRSVVVLKVLEQLSVAGEDLRQRFLREARAAAALRSPHVVQILDCGVDGETPYIAMELLDGESLEQRLARVGRLDTVELERVVRHVARAIERANEAGIVHRDLKPSNIFIQPNDGEEIVKVLDFGIAKAKRGGLDGSVPGTTPAGILLGTPHYMSPEHIQGSQDLDVRTDLWALGVIAYECLLGVLPFDGESITEVLTRICSNERPIPSEHGAVPAGFDEWFLRACAARPEDRFVSAKQAAEAFSRLCDVSERAPTVVPAAVAPAPRAARVGKRPRKRLVARVGGLMLLVGGASLWRVAVRPEGRVEAEPSARGDAVPGHGALPVSPPVSVPSGLDGSLPRGALAEPRPAPDSDPPSPPVELPDESPLLAPAKPSARPRSPVRASGAAHVAPRPRKPPAPAAAPPTRPPVATCDPPWDLDSEGRPRAKPECL